MRKKVLCFVAATILLFTAIPSVFADTPQYYHAGYTTPVRHYFTTGNSLTKGSSWHSIEDYCIETIFVNSSDTPYHKTLLFDENGTQIGTEELTVYNSQTEGFNNSTIASAQAYAKVKFRIYNPNYVSGGSNFPKMKTKGYMLST